MFMPDSPPAAPTSSFSSRKYVLALNGSRPVNSYTQSDLILKTNILNLSGTAQTLR